MNNRKKNSLQNQNNLSWNTNKNLMINMHNLKRPRLRKYKKNKLVWSKKCNNNSN